MKLERELVAAITRALKAWPTSHDEPEALIRERLSGILDSSIPFGSLRTIAKGKWVAEGPPMVSGNVGRGLAIDSAGTKDTEDIALMELVYRNGVWLVTYLDTLCPACFGTGFLDMNGGLEVCVICGGKGWGVA